MIFTSFRCDILFKLTLQAARGRAARGRVRGKSKRCHVPVPWQGGDLVLRGFAPNRFVSGFSFLD